MSSFHQSRSRIFFDTVCAFGMSTFCAVAWTQTYATAMLGAASVAGIYGLMRFTDMFRRPQVMEDLSAVELSVEAFVPEEIAAEPARVIERKPVDLVSPTPELKPEVVAALVRKPKRKASKKPAKSESAPQETPAIVPQAIEAPVPPVEEQPTVVSELDPEPDYSAPIAPLFEPEPFVRQHQRAAFGRKFGVR